MEESAMEIGGVGGVNQPKQLRAEEKNEERAVVNLIFHSPGCQPSEILWGINANPRVVMGDGVMEALSLHHDIDKKKEGGLTDYRISMIPAGKMPLDNIVQIVQVVREKKMELVPLEISLSLVHDLVSPPKKCADVFGQFRHTIILGDLHFNRQWCFLAVERNSHLDKWEINLRPMSEGRWSRASWFPLWSGIKKV